MNQRKIGEFLKQLRKSKGMTQEQLAEYFYVSSRTVSRWETGNNIPDLAMLIKLADFHKVEIREIIDGERKSKIKKEPRTRKCVSRLSTDVSVQNMPNFDARTKIQNKKRTSYAKMRVEVLDWSE